MQPIMRFDWISQLAVLLLGRNAVIDQLLVSAVLVEFGGAFFQACATPEGLTNLPGLVNNLLLFDELCEQDIEGTDRHGAKNEKNGPGDRTALLDRKSVVWGTRVSGRVIIVGH